MKSYCKAISLLLIIFLFALVPLSVSAHAGKTDENGGHYVSSTGEYHYHHGYPAHAHTNGECPYNFDDQTGQSSGAGSSNPTNKEPSIFDLIFQITFSVILVLFVAFILTIVFLLIRDRKKEIQRQKEIELRRITERNRLEEKRKQIELLKEKKKEEYLKLYGGMSYEDIFRSCNPPDGVVVDESGTLTFEISDDFFVYLSDHGKHYHRKDCISGSRPVLYYNIKRSKYLPCQKCKPAPLNTDWLRKYKKIAKAKEKYDDK